jgi:hypothetical protein
VKKQIPINMKTKMKNLIMIAVLLMSFSGAAKAQELIWEVGTEAILADADTDLCTVRIDAERRAWVLLQNDTASKLVRISATGVTEVWNLPASDAAYTMRSAGGTSALVQAAVYDKQIVDGKKKLVWVQRDFVVPDTADTIKYEAFAESGELKALWYFMTNAEGFVSKIVLRKLP